jgi:hypothetical protein
MRDLLVGVPVERVLEFLRGRSRSQKQARSGYQWHAASYTKGWPWGRLVDRLGNQSQWRKWFTPRQPKHSLTTSESCWRRLPQPVLAMKVNTLRSENTQSIIHFHHIHYPRLHLLYSMTGKYTAGCDVVATDSPISLSGWCSAPSLARQTTLTRPSRGKSATKKKS